MRGRQVGLFDRFRDERPHGGREVLGVDRPEMPVDVGMGAQLGMMFWSQVEVIQERELLKTGRPRTLPDTWGTNLKRSANRVLARERVDRRSDWLDSVKFEYGCQACLERQVVLLEMHHINPATKLFEVNRGRIHKDYWLVIAEIRKCAVLCCNCHTLADRGMLDIQLTPVDLSRFPPMPR